MPWRSMIISPKAWRPQYLAAGNRTLRTAHTTRPRGHGARVGAEPMQRRSFLTLLGGAAAWPVYVRAQQAERVRRIGVLWRGDVTEGFVQVLQGALLEGLAKLGWIEGRNVRFDLRYCADDA